MILRAVPKIKIYIEDLEQVYIYFKERKTYRKMKICPICNKEYNERPAISRKDNKTEICPLCGTKEALESIPKDKREEILNMMEKSKKSKSTI